MKIVVLDGYTLNPGDLSWDGLKLLGDLTIYDRTPNDEIISRIGDANIIITNKTPIAEEIFIACPKIEYIGMLSTGYNVVDVEAAKKRNIPVTNIPIYGTAAVSQMATALLLEICHHVWDHNLAVKKGDWSSSADFCFWNYPLIELFGKTVTIIGYGRIGQAFGKIAQGLGMNVLAVDNYKNTDLESETMRYVALDEGLEKADVISLHCPLLPSTEGIINKTNIAKCKDGVIIINTSRGGLIIEQDMADALNSDKVYAFAADVVSTEPIKLTNVLLAAPRTILTPHIAWAPKEARRRLMDTATDNLAAYAKGNYENVVNNVKG